MSLTRDEWCEIWESIKTIENLPFVPAQCSCDNCRILRQHIKLIKDKVQQVIGQME